jgi:hypothetical protein
MGSWLEKLDQAQAEVDRKKIQAVLAPLDEKIRAAKEDGLPEGGKPDELRAERVQAEKEFILNEAFLRLERAYPSGMLDWLYAFHRELYQGITEAETEVNAAYGPETSIETFRAQVERMESFYEQGLRAYQSREGTPLTFEGVSSLRLSELERCKMAIEIDSQVLNARVWIAGTEIIADQLRKDAPDAVVFTTEEFRNLVKLNPGPEALKQIVTAKNTFPGSRIVDGTPKGGA